MTKYTKRLWSDVKHYFRTPWTARRLLDLLGRIALAVFALFIIAFAVMVSTLPRVRVATPDEKIVAYCAAAPERQVEIKYETRLWMLSNRPENPRVAQGWGFGLTDAQMIAFLKIGDGVNPCPWSEGH